MEEKKQEEYPILMTSGCILINPLEHPTNGLAQIKFRIKVDEECDKILQYDLFKPEIYPDGFIELFNNKMTLSQLINMRYFIDGAFHKIMGIIDKREREKYE